MSRDIYVDQRVGDWLKAYRAVQAELTPEPWRVLTTLVHRVNEEAIDPAVVHLGMDAARIVFANDRIAAEVAAELVKFGIRHDSEDI